MPEWFPFGTAILAPFLTAIDTEAIREYRVGERRDRADRKQYRRAARRRRQAASPR